jgi:hypothetical protein
MDTNGNTDKENEKDQPRMDANKRVNLRWSATGGLEASDGLTGHARFASPNGLNRGDRRSPCEFLGRHAAERKKQSPRFSVRNLILFASIRVHSRLVFLNFFVRVHSRLLFNYPANDFALRASSENVKTNPDIPAFHQTSEAFPSSFVGDFDTPRLENEQIRT